MNFYDRISILHKYAIRRRYFDPSKREDLNEFRFFKQHNKWKTGCPFYLEWPYSDIGTMCDSVYSSYMLKKLQDDKKAP